MSDAGSLVSIVCPAYQEEDVLAIFHGELSAVLADLPPQYRIEIVYVDDGSSDGTLQVLRALAAADARVRYFSLSRNFGHQAALTAGLAQARGDVVVSLDSDLQHPPALIPEMLARWREGFDVVLTVRADDRRLGFVKRFTSKLFYRIMRAVSDTDIRAAAADFRLLSRKAVDALLQLTERHRLLRGMVQWLGFRSTEIFFQPDERRAGQSKYTLRRMLGLAGEGLFSFSRIPLRLATCVGLVAIVIGLGHALWALAALARGLGAFSAGTTYLIVSTHLLTGALLCAIGLLGEYVGRIFEQVKDRPLYLIKETSPGEEAGSRAAAPSLPQRRRDAA